MVLDQPDAGALLALLDGELDADGEARIRRALDSDPALREELAALERDLGQVRESLGHIDCEPPARSLPAVRPAAAIPTRRTWAWARAASIVLLVGLATASALPGSVVGGWLRAGWHKVVGVGAEAPTSADVPSPVRPQPAGVRVAPALGRVQVFLTGLSVGSLVEVEFGTDPLLGAFVEGEARFATASGRVDVDQPTGLVRIEIPDGATEVELRAEGRVWLRRVGGRLELEGPVIEQGPRGVRFRVAAPSQPEE